MIEELGGGCFIHSGPGELRLDHFLVAHMPAFSRARLQTLLREGHVKVDGAVATKSGMRIGPGAVVEVSVPPVAPTSLKPQFIPLEILYEDSDVIVLNKPAGMVVHPAPGHASGTLVNAVLAHAEGLLNIGGEERPGIVHRLDKDTSGVLIIAKTQHALESLQEQFRARSTSKVYLALVDGHPATPTGRIEGAIARDPAHRKRMAIRPEGRGRSATTEYRTRESFPEHTLLEVHPVTGRTHQIRLHLAMIGCPIVGDTVYGRHTPSIGLHRHFLHAIRLSVILPPDTHPRTFEARLPGELESVLADLRTQRA